MIREYMKFSPLYDQHNLLTCADDEQFKFVKESLLRNFLHAHTKWHKEKFVIENFLVCNQLTQF